MNKAFKRKGKLSFKQAYYWQWLDNRTPKLSISFRVDGDEWTPLGCTIVDFTNQ